MPRAIAFEGNLNTQSGVSWGAVAVESGETIFNAITRLTVSPDRYHQLVGAGTLVAFPNGIDLPDGADEYPLVGMMIARRAPFYSETRGVEREALGKQRIAGEAVFFVFRYPDGFQAAVKKLNEKVIGEFLHAECSPSRAFELLRFGLTLDSSDPALNAILRARYRPY